MELLTAEGYAIQRQVYAATHCAVYQCSLHDSNSSFAVKVRTDLTQSARNRAIREVENMTQLANHPNAIKLHRSFSQETPDGKQKIVMVMDWGGKDLMQDINERKARNDPYSDEEIRLIAFDLIKVLAEAERLGIAHRGIKPENVLYDREQRKVRIGGFGLSSTAGPEIFAMDLTQPLNKRPINYPGKSFLAMIKSDVFNLGTILITVATLSPPNFYLHTIGKQHILSSEISQIPYSDLIKIMISAMITENEQERPNFAKLEQRFLFEKQIEAIQPCCRECKKNLASKELELTFINCSCGISEFCSRKCFVSYVETANCGFVKEFVPCPKCSTPLNENDIWRLCGGKERYGEMGDNYDRRQLHCRRCKFNQADCFMQCRHIFCSACMELEKCQGKTPPYYCEVCSTPSTTALQFVKEPLFLRLIEEAYIGF